MFKVYALTGLAFALAWGGAWVLCLGPLIARYAAIADLPARVRAARGWPHKALLWVEGKKTLAVAFLMSLVSAVKGAADTVVSTLGGLQGTDIAPLQDRGLWGAFFSDIATLHIVAALSLLAAFLTLKGKVAAAQITPKG